MWLTAHNRLCSRHICEYRNNTFHGLRTSDNMTSFYHCCVPQPVWPLLRTSASMTTAAYLSEYDHCCVPQRVPSLLRTSASMTTAAYLSEYDHCCVPLRVWTWRGKRRCAHCCLVAGGWSTWRAALTAGRSRPGRQGGTIIIIIFSFCLVSERGS